MNKLSIRALEKTDIDLLEQISIDTFVATYSRFNTPENMQSHIEQHFSKTQLLFELEMVGNFFFGLFEESELGAYVKLRTSENPRELEGKKHIELERIYVSEKYQGMGFGYRIMQYCIDFASAKGYEVLWLGVWNQNEKAQQFYKKCGFDIFGEHVFMLGADRQTDWLMKKELVSGRQCQR